MRIGDTVKHKKDGIYGKVKYSTFGYSIHFRNEENILCKTLGNTSQELDKYWEVISEEDHSQE